MKKTAVILAICILLALFTGCSNQNSPPSQTSPLPDETGSQQPNAWVVKADAPVLDAKTGQKAGTAHKGFALTIQEPQDGKVQFTMEWMDEKGESVRESKTYQIDTKLMEKKYVEPRSVIMMISVDMIRLKAGASFYGEEGQKLITFDQAQGPFRFIQKTDKGYMLTLDMNIVYVKEEDAEFIAVEMPQ